MVKIMSVAIIKLLSLHMYQLKHKPILSFYKELLSSKHGKVFIDTLFTLLRVDEGFKEDERLRLGRQLGRL
jgi:hypothetical protein